MRPNIAILAACGAIALTACGSKTDANEKNFSAALTQYFDKKGDLCLSLGEKWPIDLTETDFSSKSSYGQANQMAVLEAAGLVKSEDAERDIVDMFTDKPTGSKIKLKRYTLTDAAKPFVQERKISYVRDEKQPDLCWGKKVLDKVVKWEGPFKLGDYQEVGVTYTYKITDMADWAKKPEIQAAFPYTLKRDLDGVGKQSQHAVKLTSEGWEALGLDTD
ncbi:MAG: hypothetical protein LBP52_01125 [Burkholderiaceae bacterium]|jgi:hypothetical protein|nr:hypothetical protein [Burkholderiaceae bacterium]